MLKGNMAEEDKSQESGLKNIDKTKKYFIQERKQNELISKRHKKVCKILNYTEHLLIFISTVIGCVSHFCFCFFNWYSCRYCKFYSRNKNLCNICNN